MERTEAISWLTTALYNYTVDALDDGPFSREEVMEMVEKDRQALLALGVTEEELEGKLHTR
jgi:hypothetical protein